MSNKLIAAPCTVYLFGLDAAGQRNPCPYPGMEDATVTVVPPTLAVSEQYTSEKVNLIWLHFGGSNLSVLVQQRDGNGNLLWSNTGNENFVPVQELLEFPPTMQYAEFVSAASKLPQQLLHQWWLRTLEVVRLWRGDYELLGK